MSQSDAHNRASGRPGNPGADPSAWMALDDEALAHAVDGAFDAPLRNETANGSVDSLLAFGAACRAALAEQGAAPIVGPVVGPEAEDSASQPSQSESERLRERRVVSRILAKTTRGERETRVIDFVSEKLRRSSFLRVAAAILVVQVTVVPLIAWHLAKLPVRDGFMTGIEPAPEVFEQDLPRLREPIEEVETRHDELMGVGTSLSAAIVGVNALGLNLDEAGPGDSLAGTGALFLDRALTQLARVAQDPQFPIGPTPGDQASAGSNVSRGLLIQALDLEARLMAFENAGRSGGLSRSIQRLSDALEGALVSSEASPAAVAVAIQSLERAEGLNLAVPNGSDSPAGPANRGSDWFECLAEALSDGTTGSSSATIDAWLEALQAR